MIVKVTEPWADEPLRVFIEEARVQLALLLHPSGQVIGQSGFTRAMDVMSACALAAAIHASASELGRQLDGKPFGVLHYAGAQRQLFLAPAATPAGTLLLLTVFDESASLGLVQLYFQEFRTRLAQAAPSAADTAPVLNDQFERELNRNLATLFGRA
jgi:hypothetical protein